ncbi:MAG TPA: formylglycine-generating enzyme family protein [Polyangiales bacterium]|nr:formylglycine-generating enzyme family protein [Polyangiales bacterium]
MEAASFELLNDANGEAPDLPVQRKVSAFAMDRFEVTLSRFARFVGAYGSGALMPSDADGSPHGLPGQGWDAAWNKEHLLPLSADAIRYELNCGDQSSMELETDLPVACVTWHLAYAFCIWDGGRLPTEAEWSLAAMGDTDRRMYPWSMDDQDEGISDEQAVYSDELPARTRPEPAGTHPKGKGKYGHEDLAGNLWEWTLDYFHERLRPGPCHTDIDAKSPDVRLDCQELEATGSRVLKGGSYANTHRQVQSYRRSSSEPQTRDPTVGFRCVRDSE